MSDMFSREFWQGAAERACKTAVQTLLATLTANATVLPLDWRAIVTIVGTAALGSLATSLGVQATPTAGLPGVPAGYVTVTPEQAKAIAAEAVRVAERVTATAPIPAVVRSEVERGDAFLTKLFGR